MGSIVWATVYAYSKTVFPEDPPSTIADSSTPSAIRASEGCAGTRVARWNGR